MKMYLPIALSVALITSTQAEWKKHIVSEGSFNTTAVAADFNGDRLIDVISSYQGKVLLLTAPDWKETTLHEFSNAKHKAIHSDIMDVDGDGAMDWVGGPPGGPAIWLKNPQDPNKEWQSKIIDADLNGIHCFLVVDVNADGKQDVLINNFRHTGPVGNSASWYEIPTDLESDAPWPRHIFAKEDAPGGSHYFGFGDLNGDGYQDITLAAKGAPFDQGNWFAYWKNPGPEKQKQAWEKIVLRENELGATNILPAKIDDDKFTDVVASNGHGLGVFWMKAPTWEKHMIDAEMNSPHCLVAADLDQDDDTDVATCGFESKRLSIYLNDGKGKFTRQDLDLDQESYDLRAIDMDNDGDLDLLNAGRRSANVVWYENPLK